MQQILLPSDKQPKPSLNEQFKEYCRKKEETQAMEADRIVAPGGITTAEQLRIFAQENTPVAFNTYTEIATDAKAPAAARIAAADRILERGHGKVVQEVNLAATVTHTLEERRTMAIAEADAMLAALEKRMVNVN